MSSLASIAALTALKISASGSRNAPCRTPLSPGPMQMSLIWPVKSASGGWASSFGTSFWRTCSPT